MNAWQPDPLEVIPVCLDNSLKRAVQALSATGHSGDAIDAGRIEWLRLRLASGQATYGDGNDPVANEEDHPNNRLLFKDMCRFFGVELGKDRIWEARAKIDAYGVALPHGSQK